MTRRECHRMWNLSKLRVLVRVLWEYYSNKSKIPSTLFLCLSNITVLIIHDLSPTLNSLIMGLGDEDRPYDVCKVESTKGHVFPH